MNQSIILKYLAAVPAILICIAVHEFTKAMASDIQGDNTPKNEKRLTLNPLNHFEAIGFFLMLVCGYDWGQPVRTSAIYYRDRKKGTLITYISPMIADLIFAFIFTFMFKLLYVILRVYPNEILDFITSVIRSVIIYSVSLAVFNIIPVYPLCGNKILITLVRPDIGLKISQYEKILQVILMLCIFLGVVDIIINPIINLILTLFEFIINPIVNLVLNVFRFI